MRETPEPLDEAAVTALLAAADTPPMPETVWLRLQAALTIEASNRSVADASRPEPLQAEIEKPALPTSQPSAVGEGDEDLD